MKLKAFEELINHDEDLRKLKKNLWVQCRKPAAYIKGKNNNHIDLSSINPTKSEKDE